jgi:hypothetical protein
VSSSCRQSPRRRRRSGRTLCVANPLRVDAVRSWAGPRISVIGSGEGERRLGADKCCARKPFCEEACQPHHVSQNRAPPTHDATPAIVADGPPIWKDAVHPQRIGSGRPSAALCSICLSCQIGERRSRIRTAHKTRQRHSRAALAKPPHGNAELLRLVGKVVLDS